MNEGPGRPAPAPSPRSHGGVAMPRRRFHLLDALILVAAAAPAILWTRAAIGPSARQWELVADRWREFRLEHFAAVIQEGCGPVAVPTLLAGTLAILTLRARRPRPAWRRLARQPGAVACGAAAVASAILVAMIVLADALTHDGSPNLIDLRDWFSSGALGLIKHLTSTVGCVVLGAWLALASGGRWAAEPSWIDRSGRLLGACWIGLFLLQRLGLMIH